MFSVVIMNPISKDFATKELAEKFITDVEALVGSSVGGQLFEKEPLFDGKGAPVTTRLVEIKKVIAEPVIEE